MHHPLFLVLHIIVSLIFAYISYAIIKQKMLPVNVGYMLILLTVAMICTHIFTFTRHSKDSFCTCSKAQTASVCQDRQAAQELYRKGLLTEYTALKRKVSNPLTF
jgi:hypothetical protein